jgi:hypothetical protein
VRRRPTPLAKINAILRTEGLLPAAQSLVADVRVVTHHTFSEPQPKVCVQ